MSIKSLKVSFMALALAFGSFIGNASAQPEEGDQELQFLFGGLSADAEVDNFGLDIGTSYGFFLSDALEVGARLAYVNLQLEGSRGLWAAAALPFINYHFRGVSEGDKILPYAGVFGGGYFDNNDEFYAFGPEVGVKFFVYNKTFINTLYRFEFFDSTKFKEGSHEVNLGIGFLF